MATLNSNIWSSLVLGADISHYQHRPDFGRMQADGVQYVVIKATQGLHVDPDFDWNRNEAARRGMMWLPYPFLQLNDTGAVMKNFVGVVGAGCPAALDWEAAGVSASRVEAWMDYCEAGLGRPGLAYYGMYPPAPVTPRVARWPRWLPQYPAHLSDGPRLPPWDGSSLVSDWSATWLVWQYTGHGRLPGIAAEIDLNRLSCPLATFRAWYDSGQLPVQEPELVPEAAAPLQLHSSGLPVRLLQHRLVFVGQNVGVDGDYGPQTQGAVARYQKHVGYPQTGVADLVTIQALNAA